MDGYEHEWEEDIVACGGVAACDDSIINLRTPSDAKFSGT